MLVCLFCVCVNAAAAAELKYVEQKVSQRHRKRERGFRLERRKRSKSFLTIEFICIKVYSCEFFFVFFPSSFHCI